jgi:hypothetical protein
MMRSLVLAVGLFGPLLAFAAPLPAAEAPVYVPGHRTWTNSWVPPHYTTKPATNYVAPRNQPLESLVEPQKKPPPAPPVSIYTPAPQYDPYYNALNAASRPTNFPRTKPTDRR